MFVCTILFCVLFLKKKKKKTKQKRFRELLRKKHGETVLKVAETAFKNFFRIVFYFFKKVVETVLKSGGNCGTYVGGIMDVIKKFVLNIF